jgi:glutamate-1-semialdehyde 2,1-aminomutase
LLVIDEVISGFRWSPGGYQATVGVTPDLSSLGKIVCGGLGGGAAVAGRAGVMNLLKIRPGEVEWNRTSRVVHPGTWNANPLNSAAGVAALRIVAQGEVQRIAEASAIRLADGMHRKIEERGIEGCVYNSSSVIHLYFGSCGKCDRTGCPDAARAMPPETVHALNRCLLLNGVSLLRGAIGWVSAVHTEEDIDRTIEVFGAALGDMAAEGVV